MKTSTKKIMTTLGLSSGALLLGLALNDTQADASVNNGDNTVTVEAGDTYKSIASENNISVADLEQANGREVGGFDWTDGRKASILLYTHFCYSLIKNYHLKV